jgi:hypothetical protein
MACRGRFQTGMGEKVKIYNPVADMKAEYASKAWAIVHE